MQNRHLRQRSFLSSPVLLGNRQSVAGGLALSARETPPKSASLVSPPASAMTGNYGTPPRPDRSPPKSRPPTPCAYRAAGWRQPLPTRSPSMPTSTRAAAPACRRAEALEVRYRAARGVGEEAHSRQPHWCPWSKSMNVETCGHVADLIVMAHAFAELRDGVVARQHEERFQMWAQFRSNPLLYLLPSTSKFIKRLVNTTRIRKIS